MKKVDWNFKNFILKTDSYKLTHFMQYPDGTIKVYSYLESRGGKFNKTMMYGLQYYLKEYLEGVVVTASDVEQAEFFAKLHFNDPQAKLFNRDGWEYIVNRLGGRLPIKIKAVKEGK
jgi:nicotinamide phosphoribosyltransferase